MDLKQLQYFLRICEATSLSEAAQFAGVSQPALSRQIKLLEEELGVVLFERHSRGIVLSEAGIHLRREATNLLKDAERIRSDLAAEAARPHGEVAIGTPSSLRQFLIAPAIAHYMESYPDVRFRIREGTSRSVRNGLVAGEMDVAVLSTLEDLDPLKTIRLSSESLFLIGPRRARLRMTEAVSIKRLVDLPLILTARPNSLRVIVDRALERRGLSVEARIEVETFQMALDLIDATGSYSVFPYCAIALPLQENRITAAPIERLSISWAIATVRERRESTATRLFTDQLISECRRKIRANEWHTAVLSV